MFGKSIQSLQEELSTLKSQADSKAMELVGRGVNPEQLVQELMPINLKIVALKDQIRDRTPRKELVARRDEIHKQLTVTSLSGQRQTLQLQTELSALDSYLSSSHRKPLTLKVLIIFTVILAIMAYGPQLIVNWLSA